MMEMAVKTAERQRGGAGRRRWWRGELLPRRRHHGGASPISLPPSWLLGSPPPWIPGGGKNVALVAANSWYGVFSTS